MYPYQRNICQFPVAATVNLGSISCTAKVAKDGVMVQGLDLMTMARVSRGDVKAEVHVAGTIRHTYCAFKAFRTAACPSKHSMHLISPIFIDTLIIIATYWSLHISCLRLFLRSYFHISTLLFHPSIIPPLHVTIDIPLSLSLSLSPLIHHSLKLFVSQNPFFHLPIICSN
jgi:hypothetical protein